jgi:hypothetical protein
MRDARLRLLDAVCPLHNADEIQRGVARALYERRHPSGLDQGAMAVVQWLDSAQRGRGTRGTRRNLVSLVYILALLAFLLFSWATRGHGGRFGFLTQTGGHKDQRAEATAASRAG